MRKLVPTAMMALVGLGVWAPSASAAVSPSNTSRTLTTDGAKATCTVTSSEKWRGTFVCTIYDTKADGKGVYVETQVQAFPSVRRSNWSGGAGTSVTRSYNVATDGSGGVRFKVCRDVPLLPDNCSSWSTSWYLS
jgi:hypothetical protein